jgi:hypothetical protein
MGRRWMMLLTPVKQRRDLRLAMVVLFDDRRITNKKKIKKKKGRRRRSNDINIYKEVIINSGWFRQIVRN